MRKTILALAMTMVLPLALGAQEKDEGHLSGSFETNSVRYQDDEKTKAVAPDDHFGSNNYLKLDYFRGRFSAGAQAEGYLPPLLGHPSELDGMKLTGWYAGWSDRNFSVTAGSFYDQFGSGLLFRSWEDRALGMNNAIQGARVTYTFDIDGSDFLNLKALWGRPRFGMDYSDTQVRGADANLALAPLLGLGDISADLGLSVLDRYEAINMDLEDLGYKPHRTGYSARAGFGAGGFSAGFEYVGSGKKYYANPSYGNGSTDAYILKDGNAQLLTLQYLGNGLGVDVALRRLEWMDSRIISGSTSTANLLNYVPGLCAQYTYMLMNLHPYTPQTGLMTYSLTNSGEIGGQADIYYNAKRGTRLGGKRGIKLHANFSTYYTNYGEDYAEGTLKAGTLLWRNVNLDVEKQFDKRFKAFFLYSMQQYNPTYGMDAKYWTSHIFVTDMTYRWTKDFSTRWELQYLHTKDDMKDWVAGLIEVNFAPSWSIWLNDMYNHGDTKKNYYNIGFSYTKSRTRISIAYGRNKAGYICSGGVCRIMPAYTGLNFTINTSF